MSNKESCPYCGSSIGYYRKCTISGRSQFNYNFDGTSGDNESLHEPIRYAEQKTMYCLECDHKIGVSNQ